VRDDLNVPLDGGRVTDDGRIRAALPTLTTLLDRGATVIICAHFGRPVGHPDPKYSLAPVAARLSELLGRPVTLAADVTGPSASIPDDRIAGLEIPTGIPLVYQLGPDLRPDALGGRYLDPHVRDGNPAIKVLAQDRP
jgi:phosphoglycerate kinase